MARKKRVASFPRTKKQAAHAFVAMFGDRVWSDMAVYRNVRIELCPDWMSESRIALSHIQASNPGQGDGTAALVAVCQFCDYYGFDCWLTPEPFGKEAMPKKKLIAWYRKHGFKPGPAGMYIRRAGAKLP